MAEKIKTREVSIVEESGTFNTFFKRFTKDSGEYNLEGIEALRKLLSKERAKLLHTVKSKNPESIYKLAKLLGRDFKSVSQDIKLFQRFGLIELVSQKTGHRERLKPILSTDSIVVKLKI